MVGLVIAFPALVTTFLDKPTPAAVSQEFDFTSGQDGEGEKALPKADEDAPVRFELEKPSR
jgi:hypothetical protein